MTTENINIVITSTGGRTVQRSLEDIGRAAHESARGLQLLHSSLLLIVGGRLLAGLGRLLDEVTNFRNRLAILNVTGAQAAAVQRELFDVASRTRTTFASTTQVFTRTALATKQLGISTRETIQFTESLQQAAVLSGASVRETNASLIQLSQALASNRFSGDEFKAVAEQLPFVLDIIAMELTRVGKGAIVTRDDIRELGIEGKLTAELILRSFRNAKDFLAEEFAKTIPTLEQSFVVFTLEMQRTFSQINETIKGTETLAKAIVFLALSFEKAVAGVLAFGAAFATIKIANFITASNELRAAVASGNAVLLTSIEIERAKAATSLISAKTTASSLASTIRETQANIALLQQRRALIIEQQKSVVIDVKRRVARDGLTGSFIKYNTALEHNIRTNIALSQTERALTAARAGLATTTAALTGAETTLVAAQTRSAAAGVAANTWTAKLARAFPGITAAATAASAALQFFGRAALANPYTAIATAIVAVATALFFLSDRIVVTEDGVVTLRDNFVAAFQLMGESVGPVVNFLSTGFSFAVDGIKFLFGGLATFIGQVFLGILNVIRGAINGILALFVGLFNSIKRIWDILPAVFEDIGKLAVNGLVNIVQDGINSLIRGINDLFAFLGRATKVVGKENPFENIIEEVDFSEFNLQVGVAGQVAGDIFAFEFRKAFSTDFVGDALTSGLEAIAERARLIAEKRIADLDKTSEALKKADEEFQKVLRDLEKENKILGFNSQERERLNRILQIEGTLKRSLSKGEKEIVEGLLKQNQVLEKAADLYDEILDPMLEYANTLKAIDELLNRSKNGINEVKALELRSKAWLDYLDTQTDVNSGIERGLKRIEQGTADAASEIENSLKSAYEDIRGPAKKYENTLNALDILLKKNKISQGEYSRALIDTRIAFLDAQTDMASGAERAFLKIGQNATDFASQMEDIVTSAFDGMSQAISDLVVDGKADFKSLISSISKMIIQLLVSKGFQKLFGGGTQLFGGSVGGGNGFSSSAGGGGVGGALSLASSGASLANFASGGSLAAQASSYLFGSAGVATTNLATGAVGTTATSGLLGSGGFAATFNAAAPWIAGAVGLALIAQKLKVFSKPSVGPNAGGRIDEVGGRFVATGQGADNGGAEQLAKVNEVLNDSISALDNFISSAGLLDQQVGDGVREAVQLFANGKDPINITVDSLTKAMIPFVEGLTDAQRATILAGEGLDGMLQVLEELALPGQIADRLLEREDPEAAAKKILDAEFDGLRLRVAAVNDNGVTLANLEKLYQLELRDIQEQFAGSISDVFSTALEVANLRLDAANDNVESANRVLLKAVEAERDALTKNFEANLKTSTAALDELTKSAARLESIARLLKDAIPDLPGQEGPDRRAGQDFLRAALATARSGGGLPDEEVLREALDAVAKPSEDLFGNFIDYQRDFIRTANDISSLADIAGDEKFKADNAVKIAQRAIEQDRAFYDAELFRLDNILSNAQAQIDAVNGTTIAVMSVEVAILSLASALSMAGVAKTTANAANPVPNLYTSLLGRAPDKAGEAFYNNEIASGRATATDVARSIVSSPEFAANAAPSGVAGLYQTLLGRAPDAAGLAYWEAAQANGMSLSAIAESFVIDKEFQSLHPRAAGGPFSSGQMLLVGEKGPEIMRMAGNGYVSNNSDTKKMLDNSAVVAEVQVLNSKMERLDAIMLSVAVKTADMENRQRKWDTVGLLTRTA